MNQPLDIGAPYKGGFFAGAFILNGEHRALIVSPKAQGDIDDIEWNEDWRKNVEGATSYNDGMVNTKAMAEAGSELAKQMLALSINEFTDWYLPSMDELEILYRNLKPTATENYLYARSGINASAAPPTYPYTKTQPTKTLIEVFRDGGEQAFMDTWYWSSTQHASDSDYAWFQTFTNGLQGCNDKDGKLRARAVRSELI